MKFFKKQEKEMKRLISFLVAVVLIGGFSAEVFAQDNMGLGRRAAAQLESIHRDRVSNVLVEENSDGNILSSKKSTSQIKVSKVTCIHKAVIDAQLVHIYDENGQPELVMVPARELKIRVRCPEE